MKLTLPLAAALGAAMLTPAAALADAPWSTPTVIPGATGYSAPVVFTSAGHGAIATATRTGGEDGTYLTPVSSTGVLGTPRTVAIFVGRIAAYANDHLAMAGTRPAGPGPAAANAPVLLATGSPSSGLGTPKEISGTAGQQLYAFAGSTNGILALVTGTASGHRERIVWIRKGSTIKRALTIKVTDRARGAAVAVGSKGDVLVVWEDKHEIFSRHIGASGSVGSAHALGAGVQSSLQAAYDDSGRQEVAWESQRVGEGDAATGATISYTSAAKGHGFTKAVVIGRDDITGTGRYVSAPGVRLMPSGTDSSVLAFTVYDGTNFRVQQANAAAGRVQAPVTLSPAGEDAVLGDLGYARAGGTLVLWRSGTRGADPSGPQRVFASYRPSGAFDFTGPEAVSDPIDTSSLPAQNTTTVPEAPFGAVDPKTGGSVAAFGYLGGHVAVSARPAR